MRRPSREFAKKIEGMNLQLAIDATNSRRFARRATCFSRFRWALDDDAMRTRCAQTTSRDEASGTDSMAMSRARTPEAPGARPSSTRAIQGPLRGSRSPNSRGSKRRPDAERPSRSSERGGRNQSGLDLLLVPSALQQLALLVLSHLLPALLDHTAHWDSPCSVPIAPGGVRRLAWLAPGLGGSTTGPWGVSGGRFRSSARPCQAGPQYPSMRSTNRLRTLPSIRLTRWRRGRKGTIGSRRIPSSAMASRIAAWPGSIICPRRR